MKQVFTLRDVTLERQQEQRRLDLYSIVAHDLRSPLAASVLRIDMLLEGMQGPLGPGLRQELLKLQRSLRAMGAMANDFLEVARFETGQAQENDAIVSMTAVTEEIVEEFQPLAQTSELSLELHRSSEEAWVRGDRRRLKQVVSNLVGNAIKFTPLGGKVEVTVLTDGEEVRVLVQDTGRGISPERLPRIFDRYCRAIDNEHEVVGSGLGLMIVRQTVRAHGGDVRVSSKPGEGSTFSFWLPASPSPAQVSEATTVDPRG